MSKILLAFCGIYGFCLIGAFFFAPLGVWGFIFESNFHPPYNWWGAPLESIGDRWNFYIGAVMFLTVGMHWSQFADTRVFNDAKSWLLLLFIANAFVISIGWAYVPEPAWKDSVDFLKWFLVYLIIVKTHSNRSWLPMILLIYVFSAVHMGWEVTWNPKGGRVEHIGTSTTREANFIAAHIATLLPIAGAVICCRDFGKRLRIATFLGVPFMLNLFAHAQSRGAIVALGAVGIVALCISRGQMRKYVVIGLVLGSLLSLRLFNDEFFERINTIETYEEDASAMGRMDAWNAAMVLASRNIFGYGAEAFDSGLGEPLMEGAFHTTHNMFFEILVAYGVQGSFLFWTTLVIAVYQCFKVQRANWDPYSIYQGRAVWLSTGVLLGFVAMVVSTLFLNRIRWEMWWIMMAYATCLKNTYMSPPARNVETEEAYSEQFSTA